MAHVSDGSRPPLISVIVPVFNQAATLQQALDSVGDQDFQDLELIVVNDGSSDGTAEVIRNACRSEWKIINHADNRGAAAARNSGIAAATGRYIALLDSDDCWHKQKLAEQVAALERQSSDVRACATGYLLYKGRHVLEICPTMPPGEFKKQIVFGCTISPGTTLLVERSVFHEIGFFDESLSRLEDWDWLLRYADRYDIAFLPKPLASVYARICDEPARPPANDAIIESIHRIAEKHIPKLRKQNTIRLRQFQSTLLVELAARMHRRGQSVRAAGYVIASLGYYPFRNVSFFKSLWRSAVSFATKKCRRLSA